MFMSRMRCTEHACFMAQSSSIGRNQLTAALGDCTMRDSGRTQQRLKIEEIATTLAECGFVALDEQAYVLGLSRSTAWTVLRAMHKNSGLSATTINRMLDTGRLPPRVRLKLLEYIAEKMSGAYGGRTHRLKAFANRISPVHMHAAASAFTEGTSTLAA